MTARRPSGFRMYRQPPPSGHFAPEAEGFYHRQNLYFRLKVWLAIFFVGGFLSSFIVFLVFSAVLGWR